jgi:hypothetical protein
VSAIHTANRKRFLSLTPEQQLTRALERERSKDRSIFPSRRPLPLADLTAEEFLILKLRPRLTKAGQLSLLARVARSIRRSSARRCARRMQGRFEARSCYANGVFSVELASTFAKVPESSRGRCRTTDVFSGSNSVESDSSILKINKSPQVKPGGFYHRRPVLCPVVAGIGTQGSYVQIATSTYLIRKLAVYKSIMLLLAGLRS